MATGLSRSYGLSRGPFAKAGVVRAVQDVALDLTPGRTLAIVGESGCGKSTLARLIAMIEPPSTGELTIAGENAVFQNGRVPTHLRSAVQMVFQNPYGSLNPRQTIGRILEEPLVINTRASGDVRRRLAEAMLERVGLRPEHYGRYPHMFSGGQRQRIAIARALMLNPKILVLDEPVSALDLSIQAQVLNILKDLQDEFGLAYLFISHDLSVVRHVADEVMVMYLGRVVEKATREALFAHPRHPYTRALLAATPVADPMRRKERMPLAGELPSPLKPPSGCAFHPRCPYVDERSRVELPKLLPNNTGGWTACHRVQEGRL